MTQNGGHVQLKKKAATPAAPAAKAPQPTAAVKRKALSQAYVHDEDEDGDNVEQNTAEAGDQDDGDGDGHYTDDSDGGHPPVQQAEPMKGVVTVTAAVPKQHPTKVAKTAAATTDKHAPATPAYAHPPPIPPLSDSMPPIDEAPSATSLAPQPPAPPPAPHQEQPKPGLAKIVPVKTTIVRQTREDAAAFKARMEKPITQAVADETYARARGFIANLAPDDYDGNLEYEARLAKGWPASGQKKAMPPKVDVFAVRAHRQPDGSIKKGARLSYGNRFSPAFSESQFSTPFYSGNFQDGSEKATNRAKWMESFAGISAHNSEENANFFPADLQEELGRWVKMLSHFHLETYLDALVALNEFKKTENEPTKDRMIQLIREGVDQRTELVKGSTQEYPRGLYVAFKFPLFEKRYGGGKSPFAEYTPKTRPGEKPLTVDEMLAKRVVDYNESFAFLKDPEQQWFFGSYPELGKNDKMTLLHELAGQDMDDRSAASFVGIYKPPRFVDLATRKILSAESLFDIVNHPSRNGGMSTNVWIMEHTDLQTVDKIPQNLKMRSVTYYYCGQAIRPPPGGSGPKDY